MTWLTAFFVTALFSLSTFAGARGLQTIWQTLSISSQSPPIFLLAWGQALAFLLTIHVAMPRFDRKTISATITTWLGTRPSTFATLALACAAGLSLQIPLAEWANWLMEVAPVPFDRRNALQNLATPQDALHLLELSIALVVIAPWTEELIFRAIILDGLMPRYSKWKSVLVSAMLFGASHLGVVQFGYAFPAGILLGLLHLRAGIWAAIAMHAGFNAMPLLLNRNILVIDGFNVARPEITHISFAWTLPALATLAVTLSLFLQQTKSEPTQNPG